MEYRILKHGEVIQTGDQIQAGDDEWINCVSIVGYETMSNSTYRRPLPAATFEESADFEPEFIIGKEPVDDVIYATDTNSEPEEWDGEGLPPIKTDFELLTPERPNQWFKCKVIFFGETHFLYRCQEMNPIENMGMMHQCKFRHCPHRNS